MNNVLWVQKAFLEEPVLGVQALEADHLPIPGDVSRYIFSS